MDGKIVVGIENLYFDIVCEVIVVNFMCVSIYIDRVLLMVCF